MPHDPRGAMTLRNLTILIVGFTAGYVVTMILLQVLR